MHKARFQNIRGGAKWGWFVDVRMLGIQVGGIPDLIYSTMTAVVTS